MTQTKFKENCEKIWISYGKMWDIKDHVLKGNLWWKDAMEDAYNQGYEDGKKDASSTLSEQKENKQ